MSQTAAHLADHVIPPVPMRQWVISVPKRLRGIVADRSQAVTALSRIFLEEIELLLCHAADVPTARAAAGQVRPRLGAVSFQHRFGSALNQHGHRHACVNDGVFERSKEFPPTCSRCGGDIRLISFITDPGPIRKILTHLGEPLEPPHVSPARGPPVDWGELAQSHSAVEFEQPSPDDLPMIDIHHR